MPGFNAQQLAYKVQNANSVVVMIGDQPIAFAQTSSQRLDFGTASLYGIGTAKPQEIQQLKFGPSIDLEAFVLTNQGIAALNYPSSILAVLANNSFDMHVMDASGIPLVSFIGCVAADFRQNVPANQIVTETISFEAMDVLGPNGVSVLNGNFALQSIAALATEGIALNTAGL